MSTPAERMTKLGEITISDMKKDFAKEVQENAELRIKCHKQEKEISELSKNLEDYSMAQHKLQKIVTYLMPHKAIMMAATCLAIALDKDWRDV